MSKPRSLRLVRNNIEDIESICAKLTPVALRDLYRRVEQGVLPDGYPGSHEVAPIDPVGYVETTSTERAALDEREVHDAVSEAVREGVEVILIAAELLRGVERSFTGVVSMPDRIADRQSAGAECQSCGRFIVPHNAWKPEVLVKGLCPRCISRFYREHRPGESVPDWLARDVEVAHRRRGHPVGQR